MTKQTWRAERFRSADIRRSIHQRAAESACKMREQVKTTLTAKTNPLLDFLKFNAPFIASMIFLVALPLLLALVGQIQRIVIGGLH